MEGLYQDLPKSLQFLRWWQCPLKSLPTIDFDVVNIVVLDLTESIIEEFLGPSVTSSLPQEANYSRTFSQLKVLILKNCKNLKSTPHFRLIANATKLNIPDSICRLSSLEKLVLRSCWSLEELPEEIGRLTSLKVLQLSQGYMQRLLESVGLLTNLQELEISNCADEDHPRHFRFASPATFMSERMQPSYRCSWP
ncbi:disease resistance protein RUN1-like [Nymphaea colorata]|uniref:disease resistance protein RUN1-like n=1 Tax=Nymphaea colorata TaxID=210225 RepID=UPI00129DA1E4|nr:disease resistance protein RUN1-like [Nymphaea colorata]